MKKGLYAYELRDKEGKLVISGNIMFRRPLFWSWTDALNASLEQLNAENEGKDLQKAIITFFTKL